MSVGDPLALGVKLREARKATGMSTRSVTALLPVSVRVSHATLANYEAGRSQPTMQTLSALAAVYHRPITGFLAAGSELAGVRYRNRKSKVGVRQLAQFEARAHKWLDAYRALEGHLRKPLRDSAPDFRVDPCADGKTAAGSLRKQLELSERDPVQSVVRILEWKGVRTIEVATDLAIDGMAARLDGAPVVVLNPRVSNERGRFNAAHELAHVLFSDCAEGCPEMPRAAERRAFEFASHLLVTSAVLRDALKHRSMVRLVQFKEWYGISVAAMVYRAQQEGILKESVARHLWIQIGRRGWRTKEPGHVREDRATRFEQLLDSAILGRRVSWQEASLLTGVREEELKGRVESAVHAHEPSFSKAQAEGDKPFLRLVE